MGAASLDITVEQGSTFRLAWTTYDQAVDVDGNLVFEEDGVTPVKGDPTNLTGCTARAQARRKAGSADPWLTASTDAGDGIALGGAAGTIELEFSDEKSEALGAFSRDKVGLWDFKLYYPSGDEERLVEGVCTIEPGVTKDPA